MVSDLIDVLQQTKDGMLSKYDLFVQAGYEHNGASWAAFIEEVLAYHKRGLIRFKVVPATMQILVELTFKHTRRYEVLTSFADELDSGFVQNLTMDSLFMGSTLRSIVTRPEFAKLTYVVGTTRVVIQPLEESDDAGKTDTL